MQVSAVEKNEAIVPNARNLTNSTREEGRVARGTALMQSPAKETKPLAAKSRRSARKRRGGRVLATLASRAGSPRGSRLAVVVREVHEASGRAGRRRLRLADAVRFTELLLDGLIVPILLLHDRAELSAKLLLRRDKLIVLIEHARSGPKIVELIGKRRPARRRIGPVGRLSLRNSRDCHNGD